MLSKCCCCIPLRTGSIVLAILGLLGGGAIFAQFFAQSGGFWVYIVEGIFYLFAYGALLFGAIKYNEKAVLINLACTALLILLGIVFAIILLVSIEKFLPKFAYECTGIDLKQGITCDDQKLATAGMPAGILIGSSLLNGYFWVCNYSFYKQLKEGYAHPA